MYMLHMFTSQPSVESGMKQKKKNNAIFSHACGQICFYLIQWHGAVVAIELFGL